MGENILFHSVAHQVHTKHAGEPICELREMKNRLTARDGPYLDESFRQPVGEQLRDSLCDTYSFFSQTARLCDIPEGAEETSH